MKKVFVHGAVVLALAAPVAAQQPAAGARTQAQPSSTAKNADHDFILEAAMGGMAEVELGQLAVSKAQSDQVKQFAQRMVTDHGKANDELKSLAQSKNVMLPTDSGAHHKAIKDRLSKMSGASFDRAYMQVMLTDHKTDVNAFRRESQSGKDAEVKAWAAKTLPTLEEHLKMAESASRSAVGTSGTKTGTDTEGGTSGPRGTTGDTARPGTGSGAGGAGTGTGTSRPGTGSGPTGSGAPGSTGTDTPR